MTETELQRRVREELGLRVGPEMAAYILRRIEAEDEASAIPVMATDARTGAAIRKELKAAMIRDLAKGAAAAAAGARAPGASASAASSG